MALSFGVNVYGIESSPEKTAYIKSVGLNIVEMSDLQDFQFDFINTEQIIEHMAEPRGVVEILKQSLVPRGGYEIKCPGWKRGGLDFEILELTNGITRKDEIMLRSSSGAPKPLYQRLVNIYGRIIEP